MLLLDRLIKEYYTIQFCEWLGDTCVVLCCVLPS